MIWIQKNVLLKDFDSFAKTQTDSLCSHIESYIDGQGCPLTYPASGQDDKGGLVCAFSVVEPCKTMTVKPNRSSKKPEVTAMYNNSFSYIESLIFENSITDRSRESVDIFGSQPERLGSI